MIKRSTLALIFALSFMLTFNVKAQEFNCRVNVDVSQIDVTERQLFENLENSIAEFMNNTNWTQIQFEVHEKIECNIAVSVSSWNQSENTFSCDIRIQSARPVYGTNYLSPVFNHLDREVSFEYLENQPMDYMEGSFSSNLTAIFAFYAYVMIGLDFQSYSEDGGIPYFRQAQNIVNTAQAVDYPGWKRFEDSRNRYWIADNLNDDRFRDFRKAFYLMHRKGLDLMYQDAEEGRRNVMIALDKIHTVHRRHSNSPVLRTFFQTKSLELTNIFSQSASAEKRKAYDLLSEMDLRNVSRYREHLR